MKNFLRNQVLDYTLKATGLKKPNPPLQDFPGGKRARTPDAVPTPTLEDLQHCLAVRNKVVATIAADGSFVVLPQSTSDKSSSSTLPIAPSAVEKAREPTSRLYNVRPNILTPPITPAAGPERKSLFDQRGSSYLGPPSGVDSFQLGEAFAIIGDVDLFGNIPITISTIFEDAKGGAFDAIILDKPQLYHAAISPDYLHTSGLYLQADVIFKGPLQFASDVIIDFSIKTCQPFTFPHISVPLGVGHNWLFLHDWSCADPSKTVLWISLMLSSLLKSVLSSYRIRLLW
ncbi:uncharacterized protein DFL_005769 [Arthrobotrys flagrans]|uniref:Uncharacterized protein n=1 Tax=Arthrobotrys flagrans TaxID=97331 RepID=A0A436ZYZ4_ARTFL|nr:hypothetical protein DFL_005769 [Arthrobotrys flagrans]